MEPGRSRGLSNDAIRMLGIHIWCAPMNGAVRHGKDWRTTA